MKIHIKNMVSLRCKIVVKDSLTSLGIQYTCVDLGEVKISDDSISETKRIALENTHILTILFANLYFINSK